VACGVVISHAGLNVLGQKPINYLTQTDILMTSSFCTEGAKNWTDGLDPHPGADYIVSNGLGLRTPQGVLDYTFQGDSLTLENGALCYMKGFGIITVNDLRLGPGTFIVQSVDDYATARLNGTFTVLPTGQQDRLCFLVYSTRSILLTGTIVGTGDFSLSSGGVLNGLARLAIDADMSGFDGSWDVENLVRGNFNNYVEVHISADDNIGSVLNTFRPDAVRLINGGGIAANGDVTISAALNRGITLDDDGALSTVGSGSVLTVEAPVTGTGDLYKRGPGTVVLSGDNSYSGTTFVQSGTLAVESVNGLGTSALSFSSGTTLRVKYPCDLEHGFFVGGLTPLTIAGTVTLDIEALEEFPPKFFIPLFFIEENANLPLGLLDNIVITGLPPTDNTVRYTQETISCAGVNYQAIGLKCYLKGTVIIAK